MPKVHEHWTVDTHGPLEKLGENLYTVTGKLDMPFGETTRRMTIAKLASGRLVVYSPIALDEIEMQKIEALGAPAYMIVPRANHRMDIKGWKERYPEILVIAPAAVKEHIEEVVAVDQTRADFGDPRVVLETVPGTGEQEMSLMVETDGGKTLAVADLIFNLPPTDGLAGLGLKILGFGPGHPKQPKLVKLGLIKDEDAMKAQMLAWANDVSLVRILPAHGVPIDNPRDVLREIAG